MPTNDTWHDLAQPRNDYDPTYFNEFVANYLMTGEYVAQLDRVSFYQKAMNYPSFSNGTFPSMRYEAKVAASFELQHDAKVVPCDKNLLSTDEAWYYSR